MPISLSKRIAQRDLFWGAVERIVLRSVVREPTDGKAPMQHCKQRSNQLLEVEVDSLYSAFERLLREGLLKAKWKISTSGCWVRTERIPPAGKEH
jgi:PadR family transcriptional regulator PadR